MFVHFYCSSVDFCWTLLAKFEFRWILINQNSYHFIETFYFIWLSYAKIRLITNQFQKLINFRNSYFFLLISINIDRLRSRIGSFIQKIGTVRTGGTRYNIYLNIKNYRVILFFWLMVTLKPTLVGPTKKNPFKYFSRWLWKANSILSHNNWKQVPVPAECLFFESSCFQIW